jgi:molybdopterin-binding protein
MVCSRRRIWMIRIGNAELGFVALSEAGSVQVTVKLDVGGVNLLSRVTRKSAHALALDNGSEVFAQVKSVAVLV